MDDAFWVGSFQQDVELEVALLSMMASGTVMVSKGGKEG